MEMNPQATWEQLRAACALLVNAAKAAVILIDEQLDNMDDDDAEEVSSALRTAITAAQSTGVL